MSTLQGSHWALAICSVEAVVPTTQMKKLRLIEVILAFRGCPNSHGGARVHPGSEYQQLSLEGREWHESAACGVSEEGQGCFPLCWEMCSSFPSQFIWYINWIICPATGSGSLSAHNLCFQLLSPNGVTQHQSQGLPGIPSHIFL